MSESPDPWPNLTPVVDGVVPASEIPQDPDFLSIDGLATDDLELEMED